MDTLQAYVLPVRGLQTGIRDYRFELDDAFFAAFPDSPVRQAALKLQVEVDKRLRELVIDFSFKGTIGTACDRCLAPIRLPVEGEQQLLVKITSDPDKLSEDPEMIYLHQDEPYLQLAPFAYEFALLAVPMVHTYDCRDLPPYPCDEEMLAQIEAAEEAPPESDTESSSSSPWDVLKDWNQNAK